MTDEQPSGRASHCRSCGGALLDRRSLLIGMAGALVISASGCLGDAEPAPEPVDLTDGETCDACGMVIADNFGPAVQAFYDADGLGTTERPARFDSVHEFVTYHQELTLQGADLLAGFATDYASVEFTIEWIDDVPYISSHAAAADFRDVEELTFVVGSEVVGAMGSDAIPFSETARADEFLEEFGGDRLGWADISTGFER